MERDAWFFLGVFIFIFILWLTIGGPTRPLSFEGPTLRAPQQLGGGTYLEFPRAPYQTSSYLAQPRVPGIGGGSSYSGGSSGTSGGSSGSLGSNIGSTTIKGVAFGSPSPYRNSISLSHHVSGAGSAKPENEYIQISVRQNGVPINLTGWTLVSETTGTASVIPSGSPLPSSGIINSVAPIVLLPGERAIISSGRSPIGASFKENKCIGYYDQFQNFSPSLPMNCPTPSSELATKYGPDYYRDAACVDYVSHISRCEAELSPPVTLSGACQTFLLTYLNYNGCVNAHSSDKDFIGTTWRVYLGRTNSMWRKNHEIVKLLDAQGKTVDAFSY